MSTMGLRITDYGQQVARDENAARIDLANRYGEVWDTDQLRASFDVLGFSAPFVVVSRKSDGKRGSLEFTHSPRFYFNFVSDR